MHLGIAPIPVGMFFFFGVQILFLSLLGKYIGAIHTQVRNMPVVVELKRVNFEHRIDGHTNETTP